MCMKRMDHLFFLSKTLTFPLLCGVAVRSCSVAEFCTADNSNLVMSVRSIDRRSIGFICKSF